MNTIKWILASSIVLLTACATSNITSSWIAPQTTLQHFNKILVLGLIRESDRNIQVSMEKHLMGDLRNLGYFALSSYEEYGPKAFNNMNEDEAINKLKNSGIDAVLTIVLLDKEKRGCIPVIGYIILPMLDITPDFGTIDIRSIIA